MKQPSRKTSVRSSGKVRRSSPCRSGIAASSGTRTRSETSITVRAPKRCTSAPLGTPKSVIGRISTARTRVILVAEPVVTSTNHGSAR